jgi:hypothetical protein
VTETETPARQIARRVIESRRPQRAGGDASPARAADAACGYLYRDLARWVGQDGCHALFSRALAQGRIENPVLDEIGLRPRMDQYLEGAAEAIIAHGDGPTAEALELMLVRLIELLGRLIGDDMAMKLIARSLATSESGTTSNTRREEV